MKLASRFLASLCVLLTKTIFVAGIETGIDYYGYTQSWAGVSEKDVSWPNMVRISLEFAPTSRYGQPRSLEEDFNGLVTGPEPIFVFFAFEYVLSIGALQRLSLLGIKEGVRIFNATEHDMELSVDDRPVEIIKTQPLFSLDEGGFNMFRESIGATTSGLYIVVYSWRLDPRASTWWQFRVTRVPGMGIVATGNPLMLFTDLFTTNGVIRTMVLHTSGFPALQVYRFDHYNRSRVRRIFVLAEGIDAETKLELERIFKCEYFPSCPRKEVLVSTSRISGPFDFLAISNRSEFCPGGRSQYEQSLSSYRASQMHALRKSHSATNQHVQSDLPCGDGPHAGHNSQVPKKTDDSKDNAVTSERFCGASSKVDQLQSCRPCTEGVKCENGSADDASHVPEIGDSENIVAPPESFCGASSKDDQTDGWVDVEQTDEGDWVNVKQTDEGDWENLVNLSPDETF